MEDPVTGEKRQYQPFVSQMNKKTEIQVIFTDTELIVRKPNKQIARRIPLSPEHTAFALEGMNVKVIAFLKNYDE